MEKHACINTVRHSNTSNERCDAGRREAAYLVLLVVSVRGDVLFGTDCVAVKLFAQPAVEAPHRQQKL